MPTMKGDNAMAPELLDTSVLARYLVGDAPDLAARARSLVDSYRPLRISLVALAEIGYLLTRRYGIDRAWVVQGLIDLLNRDNIEVHEVPTDLAVEALAFCAPSARVSFTDAMLWAIARRSGASVWTFDRAFPSEGIEKREPAQVAGGED
jgi:predicted nucleic acid-binding protein